MSYGLTQTKVDRILALLDVEEARAKQEAAFAAIMPNIVFHYDGVIEGLHLAGDAIRRELTQKKEVSSSR